MKILINAVSAKLGGAATYARNLARSLADQGAPEDDFLFIVPEERTAEIPSKGAQLHVVGSGPRVRVLGSGAAGGSYAARMLWEQLTLRALVKDERPDVLFSSANFAMLACPCPQVLLVRIPIYFSQEYFEHVLALKPRKFRAEIALRRWLVARSVGAADCVMTPTAAMRDDLARFVRLDAGRAVVNPYGVPHDRVVEPEWREPSAKPRILWVSHYADHKNLATLLRAAEILRADTEFELVLTLDAALHNGQHTPVPDTERELLARLEGVVRLAGVRSYDETWALYHKADIFVFPSLCESFGHPLVEAMASRLPIVASDIPVHREICGDAAEYFPVMDASALAEKLRELLGDAAERERLACQGATRVKKFVWEDHVARLLELWRKMAEK
ncbi:MAG TPA: glycosyltransferase family 1 protein [Candidatus Acidoferrales bacterium]|nr:glycosyltransferase family 1 protein [Candidatus Acidoferrales bacterium]